MRYDNRQPRQPRIRGPQERRRCRRNSARNDGMTATRTANTNTTEWPAATWRSETVQWSNTRTCNPSTGWSRAGQLTNARTVNAADNGHHRSQSHEREIRARGLQLRGVDLPVVASLCRQKRTTGKTKRSASFAVTAANEPECNAREDVIRQAIRDKPRSNTRQGRKLQCDSGRHTTTQRREGTHAIDAPKHEQTPNGPRWCRQ